MLLKCAVIDVTTKLGECVMISHNMGPLYSKTPAIHYTMYITLCTLHYVHYTMNITLCTLHYVHYTMYITLCTLHYVHYTMYITLCYITLCTFGQLNMEDDISIDRLVGPSSRKHIPRIILLSNHNARGRSGGRMR